MNNKQTTDLSNKVNRSNEILQQIKSTLMTAGSLALICLLMGLPAIAQTATWNYVTTITEGVKFYIGKDFKVALGGHVTAWEKLFKPDCSFIVSFVEWDCGAKQRRALETVFYNADNTVIGTRKKLTDGQQQKWTPVIPGSSAELLFARVCLPAPAVKLAEITAGRANLRAFPDGSAPVVRRANRGATFRIIAGTGRGGWFNVVDNADSAQNDYWLFADDFRIVAAAAEINKHAESKSSIKGGTKAKGKGKVGNRK